MESTWWMFVVSILLVLLVCADAGDWKNEDYPDARNCFTKFGTSSKSDKDVVKNDGKACDKELEKNDTLCYKVCRLKRRRLVEITRLQTETILEEDEGTVTEVTFNKTLSEGFEDETKKEWVPWSPFGENFESFEEKKNKTTYISYSIDKESLPDWVARYMGLNLIPRTTTHDEYRKETKRISERLEKCETPSFGFTVLKEEEICTKLSPNNRGNWEKLVNCIENAVKC